jgi:hypothetical protein
LQHCLPSKTYVAVLQSVAASEVCSWLMLAVAQKASTLQFVTTVRAGVVGQLVITCVSWWQATLLR